MFKLMFYSSEIRFRRTGRTLTTTQGERNESIGLSGHYDRYRRIGGSVNAEPEVNGGEWLMAIDADPDLFDTALVVATAMVNDGTIGLKPIEGIDPEAVQDAVEELVAHEYVEDGFSVEWSPEETEHSLRLRFPFGYTDRSGYTWPAELAPEGGSYRGVGERGSTWTLEAFTGLSRARLEPRVYARGLPNVHREHSPDKSSGRKVSVTAKSESAASLTDASRSVTVKCELGHSTKPMACGEPAECPAVGSTFR